MRDVRVGKFVLGERGSARMSHIASYDMPPTAHLDCDKPLGRETLLIASSCSVENTWRCLVVGIEVFILASSAPKPPK